jgi:hypothetical protein
VAYYRGEHARPPQACRPSTRPGCMRCTYCPTAPVLFMEAQHVAQQVAQRISPATRHARARARDSEQILPFRPPRGRYYMGWRRQLAAEAAAIRYTGKPDRWRS